MHVPLRQSPSQSSHIVGRYALVAYMVIPHAPITAAPNKVKEGINMYLLNYVLISQRWLVHVPLRQSPSQSSHIVGRYALVAYMVIPHAPITAAPNKVKEGINMYTLLQLIILLSYFIISLF